MATDKANLLTTGQAAQLCSVTPDTILKWIKKGRLEGVRTAGGHYRIERRSLELLVPSARPGEGVSRQFFDGYPQGLHCWEYLSERGVIRDDCRQCVVYRVRAARCFLLADMETDVGHARRFCESSCEDCAFYRRIKGLATKVLFITSDDDLIAELTTEDSEGVALCFARNAYEASAIIHDFRPAFVAIDVERAPSVDAELLDSLATDPRVPGLRVILVVPPGTKRRRRRLPRGDLVASILEKPFGTRQVAEAINTIRVNSQALEGATLQGLTRKD
jgi:excisionase family DNA binding protein